MRNEGPTYTHSDRTSIIQHMGNCQNYGPFLGPCYNTGSYTGPNLGDPKRDHNFDNSPYINAKY